MAGDWIKIQHATPDKPEMDQLSSLLNLDIDTVLGKCLRIWIWADQQSVDGNAITVTNSFLDRLTHSPGFAEALRKVGWLTGRDGLLSIPNFSRHNGQTAKNRALTQDRVKRKRNAGTVTESLPEKRRGEKSIKKKTTSSKKFIPPKVVEVQAYCQERGNSVDPETFVDHYTANDWMRGKNKLKDWKAAVRTWEKNSNDNRTLQQRSSADRPTTNESIANLARAGGLCLGTDASVSDEETGHIQPGAIRLLGQGAE